MKNKHIVFSLLFLAYVACFFLSNLWNEVIFSPVETVAVRKNAYVVIHLLDFGLSCISYMHYTVECKSSLIP